MGAFALGSALAGLASARIGVARTAILARVLNGLGAVWMGLAAGPGALVAAYLVTYGLHGTGGPVHATLLHREAESSNRATVLSLASMSGSAAYALASPLLGRLADTTSTSLAMVVGGAFSVLGAVLILPASRRERNAGAPTAAVDEGGAGDAPRVSDEGGVGDAPRGQAGCGEADAGSAPAGGGASGGRMSTPRPQH